MTDQPFEARLGRALVALVDDELLPFDVRSIAERAIGARGARAWDLRLAGHRWGLPLLLALLASAVAAGLIASELLRTARTDAYHAVLVRSAGEPVGDHASTAVDVVIAAADGHERVVRTIRATEFGPGARSIQSGGSVSRDGWLALFPGEQLRPRRDAAMTWAVVFVDLTDPAKRPIVVEGHGAMGPRFGPDGLVGIPASTGTVRLLDLGNPDAPERRINGVAWVGGGPEIVWAADGSGFLAERDDGQWGVAPIDGGPFRPGFPRTLSRWMSPDVPGYEVDSAGVETDTGHYLYGGGLTADGRGLWMLAEEPGGRVLAVSRAALDGLDPTLRRRVPAELAPGSPEGSTMVGLDLSPDDTVAAIRIDQTDGSPAYALLFRTHENDLDLPAARVDGRLLGWVTDAAARRIPVVPPVLVLEQTTAMERARSNHAAALLPDGRVLLTGGWDGWNHDPANDPDGCGLTCGGMNDTPVLFDPVRRSFTPTGPLGTPREFHTAAVLPDGRVLISGGRDDNGNVLGSEVFDPGNASFGTSAIQPTPRERHVSVTLDAGRVALIGGGTDAGDVTQRTPVIDVYDPTADQWTAATPNDQLADAASATRLTDGDVLVLASEVSVFEDPVDSRGALLLDAATLRVRDLQLRRGPALDDLFGSVRGSVLALDGRVLFSLRDERNQAAWPGDDSGVYAVDAATGTVSLVTEEIGRPVAGPVLIGDGRVVVLANDPDGCETVTAWVIDASPGAVTSLGAVPGIGTCMGLPGTTLTPLSGDSVLIAGGTDGGGVTTTAVSLIHPVAARP